MFLLLWLLPLLLFLFFYAAAQRKKALAAFVVPDILHKFPTQPASAKRGKRFFLLCLAVTFLILSLTRPAWNLTETTVKQTGRDVVFMIDVSKSMLATDLKPNRLERAKLAIVDCVEKLQGDRVALVAFAGSATIKCPLTQDYGFFLMMLDAITPTTVGKGGTLIGDALRTTFDQVFDNQEKQFKDVILITDGEDHESFPVQAAEVLGDAGIRLLVIGLGNENEGHRIPVTTSNGQTTFLKYNGQEVWTKLDGDTLRQMAKATPGGRYLPVATGAIDLGEVYLDLIASADKKELESKTIRRYEEKFQIFLATAILLLIAEGLLGRIFVVAFFLLLPLISPDLSQASPRSLIESGNKAYENGDFSESERLYTEAAAADPEQGTALFNKGDSLYRQQKYPEAAAAFEQASVKSKNKRLQAVSWFNLGNAHFQHTEQRDNPQDKLSQLKKSAAAYKKAYQLDNSLTDASRNLEICRLAIKELEKQQEQQQNQQDKQGDQQKKDEQKDEQQQNQDKEQKNEQHQKKQDEQQQGQEQQNNSEQSPEQHSEQSENQGSQQDDKQPPEQDSSEATGSAQQENDTQQQQHKELTQQTLEAILDAEKKLQEMRRQRMRISPDAVEKDW